MLYPRTIIYFCIALIWGLAPSLALSAQVLRVGSSQKIIAISHEEFRQFAVKDNVCVVQAGREVACGSVIKTSPKGAIVRLDTKSADVSRGDQVRLTPSARKPAMAIFDSVAADEQSKELYYNISGGISAGINFFFPMLNFQRGIGPSSALGLVPIYFKFSSNDTTVGAIGGYFTFNYYGADFFRGLWVQAGPGLFMFSSRTGELEESAASLAGMATVGWRGYWDLGLNIGVGAGFQYVQEPQITSVEVRSSNLQPLVILDLGFSF